MIECVPDDAMGGWWASDPREEEAHGTGATPMEAVLALIDGNIRLHGLRSEGEKG